MAAVPLRYPIGGERGIKSDRPFGDAATWTAAAADGYTYQGWYDAAGNQVSNQATYGSRMTADQGFTARFTANAGPAPEADDGVDADLNGTTAKTGDASAPWALALLAVLVATGGIAVACRRRITRR